VEEPLLWQTCDGEKVVLIEEGALATKISNDYENTLVTSGSRLTEGKHYWEVELVNGANSIFIGVTR
jgi:hypothetical protein